MKLFVILRIILKNIIKGGILKFVSFSIYRLFFIHFIFCRKFVNVITLNLIALYLVRRLV